MIGADPLTEWLPSEISRDERGFVLTGAEVPREAWSLERPPIRSSRALPNVLAIGDVRHGSVKRVASAVGEGSVAIQVLHELLAVDGLVRLVGARSSLAASQTQRARKRDRRSHP